MIQINIQVDGRFVKRALLIAACLIPCLALGASISIPHTFSSGTVISSNEMNENFSAIATGVNALDTQVTTMQSTGLRSAGGILAYAGTSAGDGPLTKQFSSTGGAITLAGTGGSYTVTFASIDCGAGPGTGMAVANAAGASGISCRVNGDWSNVAGGCRVFVGCFNTAGSLTATPFSLIYMK